MAQIESLGKYEIRREIGRGAMGVVYEGYDPQIKRVVALKTVRADPTTGETSVVLVARFRREAQAAGRLNHPNIVSIYDFGEDGAVSYIAMEFVKGRELKECFEANERFRIADIVRIMTQILGALDYSHRQGVVHRDIKPANIFLLSDGTVKVADFGIAHVDTSNLTQVGTVLGTPSYMSPEQIMGLPVDGRTDVFSAGVILYQFLTGERPFAGSPTTTMQKVLKEDPLPPSMLNVQVLPAMDAVVRKALAKRADDRYQTAQEFADAIQASAADMTNAGAAIDARPGVTAGAAAGATGSEATVLATPALTSGAHRASAERAPATPVAATGATAARAAPTPVPSTRKSNPAVAIVIAMTVIALAAGAWFFQQRQAADAGKTVQAPPPPAATAQAPAPAAPSAAPAPSPVATAAAAEPGTMVISAVGLIDPSDPRYQSDKALLQSDLRADSRSQTVAKALGLLLEPKSLAKNYDLLKARLLSQSASFIKTVVRETPPRTGQDGLVSITTEAVVDVKAIQKSLNQMSRDERIELIRASGDPKISVQIAVRDADQPDAPPQPSPVAENILKERIKSFGFRTWAEGDSAPGGNQGADFAVIGEAKIKRLSMRLEASGVVVTKFTLTSWTVKCIDRQTGEEIYYNTALPKAVGSWASEEAALKAIGAKIADEFSRDFFLQHANVRGQKIMLVIEGLPDATSEDALLRELVGLPEVIGANPRGPGPRGFDVQLAGSGAPGDLVANGVLRPLNAKLGQACFGLGAVAESRVTVLFDKSCADAAVLSRLETNPPASLYGAPPDRQKSVVKNPETLRKLTI
jgi:serine/threonine-protein kinase